MYVTELTSRQVNFLLSAILVNSYMHSLCADLGKLLAQLSLLDNFRSLGNMSDELLSA